MSMLNRNRKIWYKDIMLTFVKTFFSILLITFASLQSAPVYAVNYDIATTTNYNIRWDGASASDQLSLISVHMADLNGNGIKDLIAVAPATDYNSRTNSGSVYVIYDNLFSSLTGTGNTVDLATTSKWNIRYDMAFAGDLGVSNGMGVVRTADIDLDGKQDLIIGARADHGATDTGSVYIIYNTLIDDYTGTGNTVDLATTSNFNVRIDGGTASDFLGFFTTYSILSQPQDVNGDAKADIIVGAIGADYNGSLSGSIYILYNALVNLGGTGNTLGMGTTSNFSIRIDGSAGGELLGAGEVIVADINNDNAKDLVIGAPAADKNATDTGSVYILFNAIFGSLTGTGNTFNVGTSTNYNIRIDSTTASTKITQAGNLRVADIDNDGKNDVIAASSAYNASSGNIRFFLNTLLDDYTGTGNTFNYTTNNLSILSNNDGSGEGLAFQGFVLGDYFSTGKIDLIVPAYKTDFNSRSDSGSGYVIANSILNTNLGASDGSSSFALSSSLNYSLRYDGAVADDRIVLDAESLFDANNDGTLDLLFGSYAADNNSRTDSGSLYLIYNFPHSFTKNNAFSTLTSGSTFTVTGSIAASSSVTNVSAVQYLVDSNSPSGGWSNCTADDGAFNSKSEAFSCTASVAGLSNGAHTIYIRAFDDNNSNSAQSNYASHALTLGTSAISSIRIVPATVTSGAGDTRVTLTWTTSEVASTIVDYGLSSAYGSTTTETDTSTRVTSHSATISNLKLCELYHFRARSTDTAGNTGSSQDQIIQTGGCTGSSSAGGAGPQTESSTSVATPDKGTTTTISPSSSPEHTVTAILETGTVPFSATLSVEATTLQALSASNSIVYGCIRLYGVTPPQKVFLISLFNKAQILPMLLRKPVLISLRYSLFDLVAEAYPDGRPKRMYNPRTFKIAYSQNGTIGWTVLKNSVVDPVNRTVSAIHKIGGYYRIVGSTGRQCWSGQANNQAVRGESTEIISETSEIASPSALNDNVSADITSYRDMVKRESIPETVVKETSKKTQSFQKDTNKLIDLFLQTISFVKGLWNGEKE